MSFIEHNDEPGKPRAIETVFKNYRFRSRLEARWGVYFEAIGLPWEYEPEGFDLDGVWYLPDFRVKTAQGEDIWYEVKPKGVKSDAKFDLFAKTLEKADVDGMYRAELLSGDPVDVIEKSHVCFRCGQIHAYQDWVGCYPCEVETIEDGEGPGFMGLTTQPWKGFVEVVSGDQSSVRIKIEHAALTARQARFEHGAKP
jgi:hypothetical protein